MGEQKIQPLVSVIIPTFNSQKTIKFCLESIRKQTYKRIETQVVDRHSTDATVQIAKQFKAKMYAHPDGRSEARNYAAQRAAGDFLLFIDSDMVLTPRAIEECVSESLKENLDARWLGRRWVSFLSAGSCFSKGRQLCLFSILALIGAHGRISSGRSGIQEAATGMVQTLRVERGGAQASRLLSLIQLHSAGCGR